MQRVGIFGGSFDPVHNAHLALARSALTELALDELCWVPAAQPWQKARQLAAPMHREAMLHLAMAGEPRFTASRCELERSGPGYTLDTVLSLQAERPETSWFLLIGQDQYANFHTWHGWQRLLSLVRLAVAQRPGAVLQADPEVQRFGHEVLNLAPMEVSSTHIRSRIAHGQGIDDLVPAPVARYIAHHRLYEGDHPHRS